MSDNIRKMNKAYVKRLTIEEDTRRLYVSTLKERMEDLTPVQIKAVFALLNTFTSNK